MPQKVLLINKRDTDVLRGFAHREYAHFSQHRENGREPNIFLQTRAPPRKTSCLSRQSPALESIPYQHRQKRRIPLPFGAVLSSSHHLFSDKGAYKKGIRARLALAPRRPVAFSGTGHPGREKGEDAPQPSGSQRRAARRMAACPQKFLPGGDSFDIRFRNPAPARRLCLPMSSGSLDLA